MLPGERLRAAARRLHYLLALVQGRMLLQAGCHRPLSRVKGVRSAPSGLHAGGSSMLAAQIGWRAWRSVDGMLLWILGKGSPLPDGFWQAVDGTAQHATDQRQRSQAPEGQLLADELRCVAAGTAQLLQCPDLCACAS